ncbi:MAG: hypothetical protein IPL96_04410 [Holophagaceae bacterium]|nr:hypothetical protein [Holophagaceae bacterium]
MMSANWLALLQRQSAPWEPVTWNEVVVGYDFGLVAFAEIRRWIRSHGFRGEACRRLAEHEGEAPMKDFEATLWEACREATGRLPRPGGERWARAQDRWRLALVREALDAELRPEALAVVLESIWERVGCPEDMVGLWTRPAPWATGPVTVDYGALWRFLRRREEDQDLVPA